MHYKNGSEAHEGDPVVGITYGYVIAGRIHSINRGTETCNCTVAEPVMGGINQRTCLNVKDLIHVQDAITAFDAQNAKPQQANAVAAMPTTQLRSETKEKSPSSKPTT